MRKVAEARTEPWRANDPLLIFIAIVASLFGGSVSAQAPTSPRTIDPIRLEAFVDGAVGHAMRQDQIAGISVAIVDRSGSLLIKGYGIAAPGRKVDVDTLFPVQSISKTMVWIAVMQLVEQGRLHLDDPINAHLPASLQIPDQGFRKPILIRDLMSHTAGFEDSAFGHLFVNRGDALLPLDAYLRRYRVNRVREPGSVVVYSNYGATLAGAIVAHVSGMSWEDYAEQRILRPLSMTGATFRQPYSMQTAMAHGLPAPMSDPVAARLTDGFRSNAGQLEVASREFTSDPPAGALSASATDMAAYMSALLDPQAMERSGVLKAQTMLDMRQPLFAGPAGFGDMLHGFEAVPLPSDAEAFGHGGSSIYQVASMTLIPGAGIGVFVSSNTGSGRELVQRLRDLIAAQFLGAEASTPVYGPRSPAEARAHAGAYRSLGRPYFRTERGLYHLLIDTEVVAAAPNGDLLLSPSFGPSRRFMPLGQGVYRDVAGPERIAFRPLGGDVGLYDPYAEAAWQRIGYWQGPSWAKLVIALTALTAMLALGAAVRRLLTRKPEAAFERCATAIVAALALTWLAGLGLFSLFVVGALSAPNVAEIIWSYPSPALVWACWLFAAAAGLSLASLPTLAVVGRSNGWSTSRKAAHALTIAIFLACAATFSSLGFLGFSGW
ncbi:serine hydrolase domain-containing protein [Phenylobacterium sp.]|jgi:CubicO group peptidase (beta-lactamase class C family)|uniref:serine hydrolase domain-containing protein n=1 Tax=Phenylobacterium sp. TaxID=1871053 RepID=UPI002F425CB9